MILLSMILSQSIRHPRPEDERINVPAINPYYWRYRMHLGIEALAASDSFSRKLRRLLEATGR